MKQVTKVFGLSFFPILMVGIASPGPAFAQCECIAQNVLGTAELPPPCDYLGSMVIIDGLPAGTTVEISARLSDFLNQVEAPGGNLGGNRQTYDAVLYLNMSGTGALGGFARSIFIPVTVETHSAPRTSGDAFQAFDTDLFSLEGTLFFDPDFDFIKVEAGTAFGLPSPGQTTLTRLGGIGTDFEVESFFDVFYEVSFEGEPGSLLEGFAGTTQGQDILSICDDQPVQTESTTWGLLKSNYR